MSSKVVKYGLLVGLVLGMLVGMLSGNYTVWIALGIAVGWLVLRERARAEQGRRGSQVSQVRM